MGAGGKERIPPSDFDIKPADNIGPHLVVAVNRRVKRVSIAAMVLCETS